MSDIVERLRAEDALFRMGGNIPTCVTLLVGEAADKIERLRAYVARLERRLEIDRFHNENGNEFSVPPEERQTFPDGIECRDATIRLLKDEIKILRNQWEQAKQKIAKMMGGGSV